MNNFVKCRGRKSRNAEGKHPVSTVNYKKAKKKISNELNIYQSYTLITWVGTIHAFNNALYGLYKA